MIQDYQLRIERLEVELETARDTARKLNRRCQAAESVLTTLNRGLRRKPITDLRSNARLVKELAELKARHERLLEASESVLERAHKEAWIGGGVQELYEAVEACKPGGKSADPSPA